MRLQLARSKGCDALDVAVLWPVSAQLAATPIPEIARDREPRKDHALEEVDGNGIW